MAILFSRAVIDAAKQRLRIPRLWRLLNIPGKPQVSCHSPFRDDKRASFSIFDEGRQAKDHAKGKRVKFFPHADPDGGSLVQVSIIGEQLSAIGCELSYFDFAGLRTHEAKPVKDLNDVGRLDPSQSAELAELFV